MGEDNRLAMKAVFEIDTPLGLVAIHRAEGREPEAAGWIQVAERSCFPRLETSRILKPVDDLPVWSVSCFLTRRSFRKQGLLLEAACSFARDNEAQLSAGLCLDGPPRCLRPRRVRGSCTAIFNAADHAKDAVAIVGLTCFDWGPFSLQMVN